MSTDALLGKINESRDEQVALIKAEAEAQAEALAVETVAEVEAIKTAAVHDAEKAAAQLKRARNAKARQEGKLLVQTARRGAFDSVMKAAEKAAVGDDTAKQQQFADRRAELELTLAQALR